jgi:type IV pilus assembly protein PilW
MRKKQPYPHYAFNQLGLTLVEMMIAMTLGLLLMAGVTQIFISNKQTYSTTQTLGQVEDNGRFALSFLVKSIRNAGYVSNANSGTGSIKPFLAPPECASTNAWCTANGGSGTQSDRIAVQFDSIGGADCNGTVVAGGAIVVNVFWIANDPTSNTNALYCRGYNQTLGSWIEAAQPLVPGIETLQILYGEITDNGTAGVPDHYVSADRVTDWSKIKSVRIAVLAQSASAGSGKNQTRKFAVLDAGLFSFTDNQPRVMYETTISLRNMTIFNNI